MKNKHTFRSSQMHQSIDAERKIKRIKYLIGDEPFLAAKQHSLQVNLLIIIEAHEGLPGEPEKDWNERVKIIRYYCFMAKKFFGCLHNK